MCLSFEIFWWACFLIKRWILFWSQKKRLFRMLVSYGRYLAFAIDFLNHVLCCVYLHSRELNRHFSVGFWIIRSRYSFSTSHLLSFKPYNTHTHFSTYLCCWSLSLCFRYAKHMPVHWMYLLVYNARYTQNSICEPLNGTTYTVLYPERQVNIERSLSPSLFLIHSLSFGVFVCSSLDIISNTHKV